MIGNPKWFNVRKYTGWGLTPNCWQGWVYILAFILPITIINSTPLGSNIKNIVTTVLVGLLILDVIHLMSQIKKDEREIIHEAIADRNALWFIIFVILIYSLSRQVVDLVFIIAIVGAMLIKSITQFYLRDK